MELNNVIGRYTASYEDEALFVFRAFVGLLFAQHGLQKLFGMFGGDAVELASMMGAAGVIELGGGLLIALGILTRLVAAVAAAEMIAAQYIAHLPRGLVPIQNGGELGLVYFAAFLVLVVYGAGRYSIENLLRDRELF